eukprot:COSAG04_NODE_30217_length_264_cov_0.624242_1_plen_54_part_01
MLAAADAALHGTAAGGSVAAPAAALPLPMSIVFQDCATPSQYQLADRDSLYAYY